MMVVCRALILASCSSEQGKVKREVYWQYLQAASMIGSIAYVFSVILAQAFNVCEWSETFKSLVYTATVTFL